MPPHRLRSAFVGLSSGFRRALVGRSSGFRRAGQSAGRAAGQDRRLGANSVAVLRVRVPKRRSLVPASRPWRLQPAQGRPDSVRGAHAPPDRTRGPELGRADPALNGRRGPSPPALAVVAPRSPSLRLAAWRVGDRSPTRRDPVFILNIARQRSASMGRIVTRRFLLPRHYRHRGVLTRRLRPGYQVVGESALTRGASSPPRSATACRVAYGGRSGRRSTLCRFPGRQP